jgi:hypothetical protein
MNGLRSLSQNSCMWAALTDIAEQIEWVVNGRRQKITPEDWKHILSGALFKEQRIAEGIDGGFVVLGQSTSKMTKEQMSQLLELIYMFGAERGVKFGAGHTYDDYRESFG